MWGRGDILGVWQTCSFHWDFEHSPSLSWWIHGGGGEGAVMKPVSQCCLNIVDNSVKFLFMSISV